MKIVYFQRRPIPGDGQHSFEAVFAVLRAHLPAGFTPEVRVARRTSKGWWRRVAILLDARRHRGDVNHVTGDIHYVTALLPRRSTVLTIHDIGTYHDLSGFARRMFRRFWVTMPLRRSAVVTVPSEATRSDLAAVSGCDPARIRVIPNPVSPVYRPDPQPFPARPTVLAVGTKPTKNLEGLVAALEGVDCRLDLVGHPTEEQRALLEAKRIETTVYRDLSIEEMAERYRTADIVAFPSRREGFGMPIIEAQATGRPVLTSAVPPMPEVSGGAACLVDPADPAAIRRGILRIIDDAAYREQLVRDGFDNVRRYEARAIAARNAAVYEELAGAAPRPQSGDSTRSSR